MEQSKKIGLSATALRLFAMVGMLLYVLIPDLFFPKLPREKLARGINLVIFNGKTSDTA